MSKLSHKRTAEPTAADLLIQAIYHPDMPEPITVAVWHRLQEAESEYDRFANKTYVNDLLKDMGGTRFD